MRNIKLILALSLAVGLGAAATFAGLSLNAGEVKAEQVTDGSVYYYCGGQNAWSETAETYAITKNGPAVLVTFTTGVEGEGNDDGDAGFKFQYNKWAGEVNKNNLAGTAKSKFAGGNDNNNIYCLAAGTYSVSIGTKIENEVEKIYLYIDYAPGTDVFYKGTGNDGGAYTGDAWGEYTAKPVKLDGAATTFTFASKEVFGFELGSVYLGKDQLLDMFYSCFDDSGSDIYVRFGAQYDVKVKTVDHQLKLSILPHDLDNNLSTLYVLDMFGQKFSTVHKAYVYHQFDVEGEAKPWTIGTDWPGATIAALDGGSGRIYEYTAWNIFDKVVLNAGEDAYKTADLDIQKGKCFVFDSRAEWTGKWISLEAAQFIDNYMKFGEFNETERIAKTENCDANYTAAIAAYNDLKDNAMRLEVLTIVQAKDRLSAWATAHGKSLDTETGGTIAAAGQFAPLETNSINNNMLPIIIVIAAAVVVMCGGLIFIKRRRNEN